MSFTAIKSAGGRRRLVLLGAALAMGAAGSVGATGLAQIVHARQRHFKTLGRVTKSLSDQIERSRPNWKVVTDDADRIERLAAALPSWFPAGSGKGHGVSTRAEAAIWLEPRQFAQAAQALLERAKAVTRAAAHRHSSALRVRLRALGHACDSCHRRFRAHSWWW